jgi:hypothetical protein
MWPGSLVDQWAIVRNSAALIVRLGALATARDSQRSTVSVNTAFRTALRQRIWLTATGVALVACTSSDASPPASDSSRVRDSILNAAWARDSARYRVELARWLRDSSLIDSLSRQVNTDSLYALGRAMLTAEDPHSLMQAIVCEHFRLAWLHGIRPAELALKRMSDTLYGYADGQTLRRLAAVKGHPTMLAADEKVCGIPGKEAPSEIKGILLNATARRPALPLKIGTAVPE